MTFPALHLPKTEEVWKGFLLLAVAQIPLSLGNSILATEQIAKDFFPERKITAQRIGFTYSFMNLVAPFLGGFPVCHGSGGTAGHYAFGARTGGSVFIYGSMYLLAGLFFGKGVTTVVRIFPLPILGVILFFEGLTLLQLIRDMAKSRLDLFVVFIVALPALALPYGFLVGFLFGTALWYLAVKGILRMRWQ